MSDSGGDTTTSCTEHDFYSKTDPCPQCLVDVLKRQLKTANKRRDSAESSMVDIYNDLQAVKARIAELEDQLDYLKTERE